ncbi:glycosyltransferase family 4 protein [Ramlibacter sp. G-1-2-2]|uniref:Glycosyltransferase family 4 protein n=1 Tax=Ramlibacter agri TaxID=2728837 RepID=A0A848H6G2_9BURK|nr:glycosyltransferase family 4 protein [Ramlibacter agri]NML46556.1 glycosyltransferase family 4 protein [Ramlibacter agri]
MRIALFANTDWFMFNFNKSLAQALRAKGNEVILISPPGPYGEKLRQLGFRWVPAPMVRRSLNPLRELALIIWLARLLKRERVQLLHGFTIKCAVYGSIAARFSGVDAQVNAVAGMGYVFTSNSVRARILRPLVRALLKFALIAPNSRLILLNQDDQRMFLDFGLADSNSIRVLPGAGINCQRFAPPRLRSSNSRFRVLLPARMLWDKGIAEYVAAAGLVRGMGRTDIEFLLAGAPDTGNPAAVPEALLREWTESGVVCWLGHTDDMPALFASVDAVVLPSYREGLPTGLTEAAACELPIITTDVPGCREVVSDGVDGLLIPVKDPEAIARAVVRLRDDADLRTRLAKSARQKAVALYDESVVIDKTLGIYGELFREQIA